MGLRDGASERTTAHQALTQLGFAVMIPEDDTIQPLQTAWYAVVLAGRIVYATVVRRKMPTNNTSGPGLRHANAICLQLSMEAQLDRPLGFGVLHALGKRPPSTVAEAFPPGGAGESLSPAAKDAFVRFVQPSPEDRRGRGRHLRYVDRAALADYFPPEVHTDATTLVMHTIFVEEPLVEILARDLPQMGWVAWSLETGQAMPTG